MKKVKIQKSYFDTFKWTSGESETTFFCANSKSKIVASVDSACRSKLMQKLMQKLKRILRIRLQKLIFTRFCYRMRRLR